MDKWLYKPSREGPFWSKWVILASKMPYYAIFNSLYLKNFNIEFFYILHASFTMCADEKQLKKSTYKPIASLATGKSMKKCLFLMKK